MKKVILIAALFAALNINLMAQKGVNLTVWEYELSGWVETLTSPEVSTYIAINWETKKVKVKGIEKPYPFTYYTNDQLQTMTIEYSNQKLIMYFNNQGKYIGHLVASEN